MKSRLIFLVLVILAVAGCSAQKDGLRNHHRLLLNEADVMFITEDYHGAAAIYDNILEVSPAHPLANLRAGICRLNMRNEELSAMRFLERAQEQGVTEATYYLGQALHFHERFDEALVAYNQYLSSGDAGVPSPDVNRSMDMTRRAKAVYANPKNHRLQNLGGNVNSPHPEYMPVISADGTEMYFTSRRQGGASDRQDPNGDYFEDIYRSQKVDGVWQAANNVDSPINTVSHDATVALSPSGNTMLIYRTNATLDAGDIYITTLGSDGWKEPVLFSERVNSQWFEPSATIASDEMTIYFSSNRPGGYGGKDIYRVVKLPDDTWSQPINLGPNVNSSADEDGPFISADGQTLYFASTGHQSIGGYDIFKSTLDTETEQWQEPVSMGYPLNTVFDDIYLVMEASGRLGYYSTNRRGGQGEHDIYQVEFGVENSMVLLAGRTLGDTDIPIQADLKVMVSGDAQPTIYQSNARTGKYVMMLEPDREYRVEISAADYETITMNLKYGEIMGEQITEVHRDFVMKARNPQSFHE